jgi:hypothetical protein
MGEAGLSKEELKELTRTAYTTLLAASLRRQPEKTFAEKFDALPAIPDVKYWDSDTSKELVDMVFGELMHAKPEVASQFIRHMLGEMIVHAYWTPSDTAEERVNFVQKIIDGLNDESVDANAYGDFVQLFTDPHLKIRVLPSDEERTVRLEALVLPSDEQRKKRLESEGWSNPDEIMKMEMLLRLPVKSPEETARWVKPGE